MTFHLVFIDYNLNKSVMRTFLLILSIAIVIYCQTPTPPVWPDQFEQEFTEDMKYSFIKLHTKGKFFYDYTNKRYRVDRDNGKGDRYCGSVYKLRNTPCSHIVSEGKRYLYFPEKNDCCYCCDSAHGCGVLKPDWVSDAEFVEIVEAENGVKQEKWNKKGLQSNFFYQTSDTKIMTQIDQQPNDTQFFSTESFHQGISDPSVFELPPQCSAEKTCPFISVCTPLRSKKIF